MKKLFYKKKLNDLERNIYILGLLVYYKKEYNSKTKDINYLIKIGNLNFKSTKKYKKRKFSLKHINRLFKQDALIYAKCIRNLFSKLDTINTMVVGSSVMRGGFIEDKTSINFGIDSQDMYYSYMIYEKYKKIIPNLKNVVVAYSVFSSGHELEKSPQAYRCAYYKFLYDIPYKNKLLMLDKGIIEFEKKLIQTKNYIKEHLPEVPENIMPFGGYAPLNEEEIKLFAGNQMKTNSKKLANQYLKFLVDDCKKNNINVFIVLPPINPRAKKYYDNSNTLFEYPFKLKKEYSNVSIINLFDSKDFKEKDFYDLEHVTLSGAQKITNIINTAIRKK